MEKILKYFNMRMIIILTLSVIVIYGVITMDDPSDIVNIAIGGLIGYLTPKNLQ